MKLEQRFSKSDLSDICQILFKTNELQNSTIRLETIQEQSVRQRWGNYMLRAIILLFACLVPVAGFSEVIPLGVKIALYVVICGIIIFMIYGCHRLLGKKMNIEDAIRHIYGKPYTVTLGQDAVTWKDEKFLYTDIKNVMEYHNLLVVIYDDNKFFIMKAEDDEKEAILSKMNKRAVFVQ